VFDQVVCNQPFKQPAFTVLVARQFPELGKNLINLRMAHVRTRYSFITLDHSISHNRKRKQLPNGGLIKPNLYLVKMTLRWTKP
ncbi:MAG: hypothetical protein LPL29_09665, partial [Alphaproteobacteria bacterium]|nr:hypothetical protein [Alphaproteobacteria bacterium]